MEPPLYIWRAATEGTILQPRMVDVPPSPHPVMDDHDPGPSDPRGSMRIPLFWGKDTPKSLIWKMEIGRSASRKARSTECEQHPTQGWRAVPMVPDLLDSIDRIDANSQYEITVKHGWEKNYHA